ncbi:hypothetical protein [Nocardia brasiliensis]|uniref:hypothetical protein n=1 Tax=Nocardia brasiliensis TaxID=37326 RepID=UPI00245537F3|nr:hypothetical protein [Nocardia brasiliensis]
MTTTSREWRLRARPTGEPKPADFELAETELADPAPGQVLVRNEWLSVDPYMRGQAEVVDTTAAPAQTYLGLLGLTGLTVYDGIDNAPDVFLAMMNGGNTGKMLVHTAIGDNP